MRNLVGKEFHGIVREGTDPKNRGRYEVQIFEFPHLVPGEDTIYCVNQVHKYRETQCDSGDGFSGQYFPLHPGMRVIVKFQQENFNSGYIDRIISDYYENSLPLDAKTEDRDEYYQLLRTVANDLFAVTKETQSENFPKNGIHLYFNEHRCTLIINKDGFHLYSDDNFDKEIEGFGHIRINEKFDIMVGENLNIEVFGDLNLAVNGHSKISANSSCSIAAKGDCNVYAKETLNILSSKECNIDAPRINLNSKKSKVPNIPTLPEDLEQTEVINFNEFKEIKLEI